jgi:hypothetical protein
MATHADVVPGRRRGLVVLPDRVVRPDDASGCLANERAAYEEGGLNNWPVAEVLPGPAEELALRRYRHNGRDVPPGWTLEGWAFRLRDFYAGLPFRHGDPKWEHVVYDDPLDLRLIDLEFARRADGTPFAPGEPYEEWVYASERSVGWDAGLLLLRVLGAPDEVTDAYEYDEPLPEGLPAVAECAWWDRASRT